MIAWSYIPLFRISSGRSASLTTETTVPFCFQQHYDDDEVIDDDDQQV
jgi:hypothetical protein